MNVLRNLSVLLLFVSLLLGCGSDHTKKVECMDRVIKIDDSLGKKRNNDCKTSSLSATIVNYTNGMKNIDFSGCPEDFKTAFRSHISAWDSMMKVTDNHDGLRGEMHDLFDTIERTKDSLHFKTYLDAIWATWANVEEAIKLNE